MPTPSSPPSSRRGSRRSPSRSSPRRSSRPLPQPRPRARAPRARRARPPRVARVMLPRARAPPRSPPSPSRGSFADELLHLGPDRLDVGLQDVAAAVPTVALEGDERRGGHKNGFLPPRPPP